MTTAFRKALGFAKAEIIRHLTEPQHAPPLPAPDPARDTENRRQLDIAITEDDTTRRRFTANYNLPGSEFAELVAGARLIGKPLDTFMIDAALAYSRQLVSIHYKR